PSTIALQEAAQRVSVPSDAFRRWLKVAEADPSKILNWRNRLKLRPLTTPPARRSTPATVLLGPVLRRKAEGRLGQCLITRLRALCGFPHCALRPQRCEPPWLDGGSVWQVPLHHSFAFPVPFC